MHRARTSNILYGWVLFLYIVSYTDVVAMNVYSWSRSNRFIISAIVQGAIITGFTISIVSIQMLFHSKMHIIQFLSLSFEGPAKWFLDIFLYDIGSGNSSHSNLLPSPWDRYERKYLWIQICTAWIHLVGMNVGGAATTLWYLLGQWVLGYFWSLQAELVLHLFSITTKCWSHGAIYSAYICICRLT